MITRHYINIIAMMIWLSLSALQAQQDSVSSPEVKKNSFGLGLGIPYGVLGGNLDINVASNLNLSAGIGTTLIAGIGYNLGLKYFFIANKRTFRPRISVFYGTNMVVEQPRYRMDSYGDKIGTITDKKSYSGLNLGIGAQWMWGETKSNGLDFDIIYVATTGFDIEELRSEGFTVAEPVRVKISIGYRHVF